MPDAGSRGFFKCIAQREAQRRICLYIYWFLAAVFLVGTWREAPGFLAGQRQTLASFLALTVIDIKNV